jgi:hypothetical protein
LLRRESLQLAGLYNGPQCALVIGVYLGFAARHHAADARRLRRRRRRRARRGRQIRALPHRAVQPLHQRVVLLRQQRQARAVAGSRCG